MTTCNTYAEARLIKGCVNVYRDMHGKFLPYYGGFEIPAGNICNPADHCMSIEAFLEAGYKFVKGDQWENRYGLVVTFSGRAQPPIDKKGFVLSAKALEDKNINNIGILAEKAKIEALISWKSGDKCIYLSDDDKEIPSIVICWHPLHPSLVIQSSCDNKLYEVAMVDIKKPETPEQKKERELLENGKAFYESMSKIEVSVMDDSHEAPVQWVELGEDLKKVFILQAEHLGYRKPE